MLLMAVSGAAVLAFVCWAALREAAQANEDLIPQHGPDDQVGDAPVSRVPDDGEHAGRWVISTSHDFLNGSGATGTGGALGDATIADADVDEALAAAAALWRVLVQRDPSRGWCGPVGGPTHPPIERNP